ncbi:hypothetical protein TsFJ059_007781 [Trichoderma semiorbis]|uniref:Uncharacterized protein n=1 Tax=Trichoderma semiorbis TaxID=1491008 RepID=A0A9P8HPR5_9HYPO|nr:hypothetical protein TsFJ059_007781 [Trichoderma semiorbis]
MRSSPLELLEACSELLLTIAAYSPDASWHLSLARHADQAEQQAAGMIGPCPGWHQLAIRCHPRPHHRLVGSLREGADPGRRDD